MFDGDGEKNRRKVIDAIMEEKSMCKKIISVVLFVVLLISAISYAETIPNASIWEQRAYVDEFDLPTDEYYVSNVEPIVGKFSNSATTDSLLLAYIYLDEVVSIKLLEYGDNIVKNPYSSVQTYDVVMMDPLGEKYYFNGYLESGSEVISFDAISSNRILSALCQNGTVRFAITNQDSLNNKYILTIEDSSGIDAFLSYISIGKGMDEIVGTWYLQNDPYRTYLIFYENGTGVSGAMDESARVITQEIEWERDDNTIITYSAYNSGPVRFNLITVSGQKAIQYSENKNRIFIKEE